MKKLKTKVKQLHNLIEYISNMQLGYQSLIDKQVNELTERVGLLELKNLSDKWNKEKLIPPENTKYKAVFLNKQPETIWYHPEKNELPEHDERVMVVTEWVKPYSMELNYDKNENIFYSEDIYGRKTMFQISEIIAWCCLPIYVEKQPKKVQNGFSNNDRSFDNFENKLAKDLADFHSLDKTEKFTLIALGDPSVGLPETHYAVEIPFKSSDEHFNEFVIDLKRLYAEYCDSKVVLEKIIVTYPDVCGKKCKNRTKYSLCSDCKYNSLSNINDYYEPIE